MNQDSLDLAIQYAREYLEQVQQQRVFPDEQTIEQLSIFDEPLPISPQNAHAVINQLHQYGSPATVAQGGGRYFGFVNGGVLPISLAARWLADAWDQNAALYIMSPIAAKLEQVVEGWLAELLGLPSDTAAGFVSGSSTATLCGIIAGRDHLLSKLGWDVKEQGLFGAPVLRVILSEEAHSSVYKALSLAGIGRNQIEWIRTDEQGRLDANHLPQLDEHSLVILQAGNVNSGAFDPFTSVCQQAQSVGAWVHIDGAFGLWAAACQSTRHLTQGIELADSWSADGHKTLNTPYDNGLILCRHRPALQHAMQASGAYLQFTEQRDSMRYTPEMSRRARGIELWAALKSLGHEGVDGLIAQLCDRAQQFARELEAAGFHVLNDVVFNQVVVTADSPQQTEAVLHFIQDSGECWCGASNWRGQPVIRISVCSWRTTAEDVTASVSVFKRALETA